MFGRQKRHPSPAAGAESLDLTKELKSVLREVRTMEDANASPLQHVRIKQLMSRATPAMIARAEQELVEEGFSQRDLVSACDAHLELFREATEKDTLNLPPDHPLSHFELDHRVIMKALSDLRAAIAAARTKGTEDEASAELTEIGKAVDLLHHAENHNVRQENTLFPILERHGIEQPPAIMWDEHTAMRADKKALSAILAGPGEFGEKIDRLDAIAVRFTEKFASHTQKETHILYPAALQLFSTEEWQDVKEECDSLGYFTEQKGAMQ